MTFNILQNWNETLKSWLDKFQNLWINKTNIDSQVQSDFEKVKSTTLSKQKVAEIIKWAPEWTNPRDIINGLVKRWYTLEGFTPPKGETPELPKTLQKQEWLGIELPWIHAGAIWTWFEVTGNILWLWADLLTPKESEWLWDELRKMWIDSRQTFLEATAEDPEALSVKLGWILWKYWLALAPTPFGKSSLIKTWAEVIGNIPKIWNIIRSWITWATQVWQFEAITEWEITPTWLATWFIAWPIIDKVSWYLAWPIWKELIDKASERFSKLAKTLSPSRTTKWMVDQQIKKGTEWAIYIREMNPDIKLEWWLSQILDMSKNTRDALWRELSTTRWLWNVNQAPVIKWIDDVIDVLKNPTWTIAKTMGLDKQLTKEIDMLWALPNRKAVLSNLSKVKQDILDRWLQSVKQVDDYIIWLNQNLKNFFAWKSEKLSSQVEAAVASKLRQNLDESIWGLWAEFRKIKEIYWKVRTFEDNLNKVYVQSIRSKDAQLWDFADTFILSNMWASLAAWDVSWFAKAFLQKGIKEQIKKQNDPNYVLEKMFNWIDQSLDIAPTWIAETIRRTVWKVAEPLTAPTKVWLAEWVKTITE